jgi:hypothetical protein
MLVWIGLYQAGSERSDGWAGATEYRAFGRQQLLLFVLPSIIRVERHRWLQIQWTKGLLSAQSIAANWNGRGTSRGIQLSETILQ